MSEWNAVTRLRNIILQTSQFKNTKQITLLSQTGVPEVQLCQKHNKFFTIVIHSITPKLTIPSCIIQITIEFPSVKYFICNFNVTLISLHHCIFVLFILLIIIYKEILKNSSAEKKHKYVYFSFVCYSLRNHILQNTLCTGQAPFEIPSNSSSQKWFFICFSNSKNEKLHRFAWSGTRQRYCYHAQSFKPKMAILSSFIHPHVK